MFFDEYYVDDKLADARKCGYEEGLKEGVKEVLEKNHKDVLEKAHKDGYNAGQEENLGKH